MADAHRGRIVPRNEQYYLNGGDLYLQTDDNLFRVHRYFFERESPKFQELLKRPPPPGKKHIGSAPEVPIMLPDISTEELEQFLWVIYNPIYTIYEGSLEEWVAILRVACRLKFPQIKQAALRELQQMDMETVDRIVLYRENSVDEEHLMPLYMELCARSTTLSLAETEKLGTQAAVFIFQARERLRSSTADGTKSPLPRDLDENDVLVTLHDLMKDFTLNSENRKSIPLAAWAAAYQEALANAKMPARIRKPRPLPPSHREEENNGMLDTVTEVSTQRSVSEHTHDTEVDGDPQNLREDTSEETVIPEQNLRQSEEVVVERVEPEAESETGSCRSLRRMRVGERGGWTLSTVSTPPFPGSWRKTIAPGEDDEHFD
ncbi:hypothetical protein D9758_006331 [Tetrapyrgos nigripes]|uniref:BTB domain-containing protein n=1 Tax=Tetrapyrgos nigripes TaxID=182062 RepID=A0A8H5DA70_9AGAR|nr:hypothetical protein D9758_006331 [Tetrapyrgos nigripes]